MVVKVTNNTGRVIGGMVDNISYRILPGENFVDGPLAQYKRAIEVLNFENGVELSVSEAPKGNK